MNLDDLPVHAQTQAKLYALQLIVSAILVRIVENSGDIEGESKTLIELGLGSAAKFDFRGDSSQEQVETVRAIMESFITETITASAQSARLRNQ